MPDELMLSRAWPIMIVSACILFAAWPAGKSWAGWQQDMVCQGSSGGGCPGGPAPTVPNRRERFSSDPADSPDNANQWRPIDPLEAERAQRRKEAQDKLIQANWVSVSSMSTVSVPGTSVSVAPGSKFFGTVPSDPRNFTAPIARVAMKGTPIPDAALLRAVTILAAAKARLQDPALDAKPLADEEIAFLAGQAALAMEGAPLQIIVSRTGGAGAAQAAKAIRPIVVSLGRHRADLEGAITTSSQTLKAYGKLKQEQDAQGVDLPRNLQKHGALAETYEKASGQAVAARRQLVDENLKIESIIEHIKN
jgi:hypothetical protein